MSMLKSVNFPTEWTTIPFGRVAPRVQDSGRPDLESLSVFLGAGVVPRSSREDNHNQLGEDMGRYLVVEPGDIVFNKLRTWQGGLGASKYLGLVSPAYFVCRPKPDFDSTFLQYLLLSSTYLQELTRISKWQPPSQFDIGWEQLKLLPIVAPDLARQKAIADYLDRETARIDALIEKKIRYRLLIESRRQSTIDLKTEPSETDLPWRQTRIDRIGSVKARVGWKALSASEYVDEGFIFLSTPNIKHEHIDFQNVNRITKFRYHESPELMLSIGDILLVKDGSTLGITNIVRELPEPATVNGSIAVLRTSSEEPRFIRYFLASSKIQLLIDAIKGGMGVPHLFQEDIKKIRILCPSIERQKEIADFLDHELVRFDKILVRLENQIEKLSERRQAIITAAVTGDLEISEVAS